MNIKNNKNFEIILEAREISFKDKEGIEHKIKLKMADEMFEELEYEKIKDDEHNAVYEKGASIRNRIIFSKTTNTVCCISIDEDYEWNDGMEINMQELQTINKKCQELGWIE